MVVFYGCGTYVRRRRLCGSLHSSVTRKGQGGTHQYHAVGSHIFLVADVHLHPILFICPAGGKAARRVRTAHAIGCGIHALVCAFLSVHGIAQFGYVFLRLDGSPNFAMMCNVVAAVLNILLDYLFIFPFGWGMFGAALASAIGTTVGALMIVFYLMRRRCALRFHPIKMSRKSMQLMRHNIGYMCRLGSSAFLCEVAIACMMFVGNQVFIHYLKEDGVAAFSIACYFFPIIFMVYNAIAQSAQPIISYNYGLNESQRVRRAYLLALKTVIGCGVCFALATIFCSPEIVGMFIDRSYPAYDIAVKGLPLYATGFVFFAVNIVSIGYFQSVERAKYATVITLLRGFILLTACFSDCPCYWETGESGLPLLLQKC